MMYFIDRWFLKQPRVRRLVTRLLEGDREHEVTLLGAQVRVHSIKEHGYLRASRLARKSVLLREELPVLLNLAALLAPGDAFVDAGANVGVFSLALARLRPLAPGMSCHAFEANPDTFARLAPMAAAAGVAAHQVALSDREGTLEFVPGAVSHVFTTVEHASEYSLGGGERVRLPCRRLDSFAFPGGAIVLKVDVEGQELAVLRGAEEFFRAGRVKAVYLDGYKDRAVEEFLSARGFTLLDAKTLAPAAGHVFGLLAVRAAERREG